MKEEIKEKLDRSASNGRRPCLRPFLIQSDSASRKRPFSAELFFDWIFLVLLLIVNPVDFIAFVLFLEAVGVRVLLYGSRKPVGSSVLRAFFASNACFTREEPLPKRVGGVGLSRNLPKLRLWCCIQPRAAKAIAGAAVVGKMTSITRATAVV